MKFLIIGLGNVGSEYENTRHNIGFSILDHLASELSVSFVEEKYGYYASSRYKSRTLHFLKPSLFMNNSGKSCVLDSPACIQLEEMTRTQP